MYRRLLFVLAAVTGLATLALAQQPAAQPEEKHPYEITPKAGPWAICVRCFFDNIDPTELEDPRQPVQRMAQSLAVDFVTELRKDYQLQAYMFNRGDEDRKKEQERAAAERKQRIELYRKMGMSDEDIKKQKFWVKRLAHVQDQYMVLIGGFADQDTARMFLEGVRKMRPPSARFMDRLQSGLAGLNGQKGEGKEGYVNPFQTSFVVPNPTVPVQKPQLSAEEAAEFDVAQFNTRNPYNLLKHAGKWTLVVKVYRGPSVNSGIETRGVMDRGPSAGKNSKTLEAMGKMAEQLASILRSPQLNYDAYVMHANYFSLVTVGIFDSPNDPKMAQLSGTLSKLRLDPEQLMSPPQPMPVPKKK